MQRAGDGTSSPMVTQRRRIESVETIKPIAITQPIHDAKLASSSTEKKLSKDLWFLHGKYYDLTSFIDTHPGGRAILIMAKGMEDSTPCMESYHAFANKEYIAKLMAKYEIDYVPEDAETRTKCETTYTFEPNGFYSTLTQRLRVHFGAKSNESVTKNIKANKWWAVKVFVQASLYVLCYAMAFLVPDVSFEYSALFAALAGMLLIAVGMTSMHDASHYAIGERDSWKNKLVFRIWNAIAFWDPSLWLYHHTIRHHTYTGDGVLDPDTQHAQPAVRKHLTTNRSDYFNFPRIVSAERWFWAIWSAIIYVQIPGMYVMQVISYNIIWPLKGILWGMPIALTRDAFKKYWWEYAIIACMIGFHFVKASPLVSLIYFTASNLSYAMCIVPDHDTYESAIENHVSGGKVDWGEIQVRHSSDFGGIGFLGRIFTEWFGSINVQIAHHLYPSVNHIHLPEIAPIIKQTCEEFNIPYAHQGTMRQAIWSFIKTVHACMGVDDLVENTKKQ